MWSRSEQLQLEAALTDFLNCLVLAVSGCVALCDLGPRTSDWEPTFSPSFNYAIIPCGTAQNKFTVYSCTGACKEA